MAYERPKNKLPLPSKEKSDLLKKYYEHYRKQVEKNRDNPEHLRSVLNAKAPRDAFKDLLNELGEMILTRSKSLASNKGPIRDFLNEHELPEAIAGRLPSEFRVFCLALNAVKQWAAAEQSATDRYLLGGQSHKLCREVAETCLVSGDDLSADCELHHPVRDGRPAIPLSQIGHRRIEGQNSSEVGDPIGKALSAMKRRGNRSWVQLWRGCRDLIGQPVSGIEKRVAANNRAFANQAAKTAKVRPKEIIRWLEKNHKVKPTQK